MIDKRNPGLSLWVVKISQSLKPSNAETRAGFMERCRQSHRSSPPSSLSTVLYTYSEVNRTLRLTRIMVDLKTLCIL